MEASIFGAELASATLPSRRLKVLAVGLTIFEKNRFREISCRFKIFFTFCKNFAKKTRNNP